MSNFFSNGTAPHLPPTSSTILWIPLASLIRTSLLCNCNFWKAVPLHPRTKRVASSKILLDGHASKSSSTLLVHISTLSTDGSKVGTRIANWFGTCPVSLAASLAVPDMSPGSATSLELVTDPEPPEWCPWHPSQAARQHYVVLFLQLIAQRPIGHDRNALPSTEGKGQAQAILTLHYGLTEPPSCRRMISWNPFSLDLKWK